MPARDSRLNERKRERRAGSWRVSFALMACLLVAIAALHTVLDDFRWWFPLAGFILAILGSSAITRAVSSRAWLPPVVGSLVALVTLTVFFAPRTAFLAVIPSFATLDQFGDLAQAGGLSISSQSPPATPTYGILFLLCLGISVLTIVAETVAVGWRRPALAAIPLSVVVAVPWFVGPDLGDVVVFVLTAICWLILLRAGQPHRQTARSFGLGAVAVVLALVSPLVLPPVNDAEVPVSAFRGYLTGVNPVLNLGKDLRRGQPQVVLTYRTTSGKGEYLRLVSLQNFTAETWAPDPPTTDSANLPDAVGAPPGLTPAVSTGVETTTVDVRDLASPWLPVPYPATSVSGLRGDWFWNADDLTFTSPSLTARGERYQVTSLVVAPTAEQLEAGGRSSWEGTDVPRDAVRYLELPEGLPPIIRDTAEEVTRSASSSFAKAVALQNYFRDGGFEYSEDAPGDEGYDGTGMGMIAAFLTARSGYCIHFASAMAVMARTLGIPSRVAVGFVPGEQSLATEGGGIDYRVTTKDLHTWPELFFEGVGWVRFEPTPGRGFVPSYAMQSLPGAPDSPSTGPSATPTPTPSADLTPSIRPSDHSDVGSTPLGEGDIRGVLLTVYVLLSLLLILLVPALVRVVVRAIRRRRLARGAPLASTGWREIMQSAKDLGIPLVETGTPRELVAVLGGAGRLGSLGRAALADALAAVLAEVEREAFAPPQVAASASGARKTERNVVIGTQVSRVLAGLRSGATRQARMRAALVPPSVWSRWTGR